MEHTEDSSSPRLGAAVIAPHEPDIVNVHVRYPPLLLLETHPDTDGNVGGQAAAEPRLFRTEKLWRPSTDSHESEMGRDGGA